MDGGITEVKQSSDVKVGVVFAFQVLQSPPIGAGIGDRSS